MWQVGRLPKINKRSTKVEHKQLLDGCLWDNVNTNGGDIYSVITNTADMYTCQYHCSKDLRCLYFTHNKIDQNCYLKNGNKIWMEDPLAISGPNNCYKSNALKGLIKTLIDSTAWTFFKECFSPKRRKEDQQH